MAETHVQLMVELHGFLPCHRELLSQQRQVPGLAQNEDNVVHSINPDF